jgi:uncharacterized protein (DUF486 family)
LWITFIPAGNILIWRGYLRPKTPFMFRIVLLLIFSNVFMTIAWYGHLKQTSVPLWKAIIISWGIAFLNTA